MRPTLEIATYLCTVAGNSLLNHPKGVRLASFFRLLYDLGDKIRAPRFTLKMADFGH